MSAYLIAVDRIAAPSRDGYIGRLDLAELCLVGRDDKACGVLVDGKGESRRTDPQLVADPARMGSIEAQRASRLA
jgi:hypothetical protein